MKVTNSVNAIPCRYASQLLLEIACALQLPGLWEVITRAVSVFCFRMQSSWLEYSQIFAG